MYVRPPVQKHDFEWPLQMVIENTYILFSHPLSHVDEIEEKDDFKELLLTTKRNRNSMIFCQHIRF